MSARAEAIVAAARGWIGTPYIHQASLKGIGCDCLGLLRGVWREVVGVEPERPGPYSPDWAEAGGNETLIAAASRHLAPASEISPGCVLVFRWRAGLPAKHCAIATSLTTMIHAHDGACVAEIAIAGWWRRRIAGAFVFPEVGDCSPRRQQRFQSGDLSGRGTSPPSACGGEGLGVGGRAESSARLVKENLG